MKRCSSCRETKPEGDFYRDKRTADGLKYQCKKCHCATTIRTRDENKKREANKMYMRSAVAKNPEKYRALWRSRNRPNDDKKTARSTLNAAVMRGAIVKPCKCQECGESNRLTAHHNDYSKPLQVEWLCYECHGKRGRKPAGWPGGEGEG